MIGRLVSFWDAIVSGAMLVSGSVILWLLTSRSMTSCTKFYGAEETLPYHLKDHPSPFTCGVSVFVIPVPNC